MYRNNSGSVFLARVAVREPSLIECSANALLYKRSEVEEYFFRAARMLKGVFAIFIRSVASLIQLLMPVMLRLLQRFF